MESESEIATTPAEIPVSPSSKLAEAQAVDDEFTRRHSVYYEIKNKKFTLNVHF